MVFNPHVSQESLGTSYDLEKEIHGEWMTVARKKKPIKEASQTPFDGLKASIQKTNVALATQGNLGGSKSSSKPKRRHQDPVQPSLVLERIILYKTPTLIPIDKGKAIVIPSPGASFTDRSPQPTNEDCPVQSQVNTTPLQQGHVLGESSMQIQASGPVPPLHGQVDHAAMDTDSSHVT